MGDPNDAINVLHGYVHEGVWKKYNEPAFRRWVWTLRDSRALLVISCLALLTAFTQTRAWVIARYLIYQRKKSVRFSNTIPDDLQSLSQGKAIVVALPSISDRHRPGWPIGFFPAYRPGWPRPVRLGLQAGQAGHREACRLYKWKRKVFCNFSLHSSRL